MMHSREVNQQLQTGSVDVDPEFNKAALVINQDLKTAESEATTNTGVIYSIIFSYVEVPYVS